MNYHLISFITLVTVFIAYVSFIWIKYGVQPSISDSYYRLPKKWNFLFTLFCWGFAIPAMILGTETTALMFFAGAGIAFVGAAAQIRETFVYKIHTTAAVSGIVLSQLAILFGYHMWEVNVISIMLAIMFAVTLSNRVWWIEIVAFLAIVYTLFTQIIV